MKTGALRLLLFFSLLVLVACSNEEPEVSAPMEPVLPVDATQPDPVAVSPPAVPAQAPEPIPQAAGTAPAAAPIPLQQLEGAVHPFMTSQLRLFVREQGRMPTDFSEFASARMDSVPFPPDGMRYVIDPATVEVKVIRK